MTNKKIIIIPPRRPKTPEEIEYMNTHNKVCELFNRWINKELTSEDAFDVIKYQDDLNKLFNEYDHWYRFTYKNTDDSE